MRLRIAAALSLLAIWASPVESQTVDQSNYLWVGPFNPSSGPLAFIGQTFRPTASHSAGAGFYLENGYSLPGTGTLNVELWTDVPSLGGSLLASGSTSYDIAPGHQSMIDVFWPAVPVSDATYFLLMYSNLDIAEDHSNWGVYVFGEPHNPYLFGEAWFDTDGYGSSSMYQSAPSSDLTFEEFSEGPTPAPEPSAVLLMSSAMFALVLVQFARTRRAGLTGAEVPLTRRLHIRVAQQPGR